MVLYHSYVPVLDDYDVVEWDSDPCVLRWGLPASALVNIIRNIEERTE
ncbi:hypothetical protein ACFQH2_19605 [Natronoarchaeum sp. GCM10025703]